MALILDGNNTPTAGGIGYGDGTELAFTAAGTSGQPVVSGGAGAPVFRPYTLPASDGSASQVLQTNGSGALSFATVGGGIVTIASGSFPSAAVLDIINIPATYAYLVMQVNGASSDTGSNFLLTQVSVNNGTSFDTTANNYLGQMLNSASVSNTSLATLGTYASTAGIAELGYATIVLEGYQGGCNLTYNGRITHSLTDRERTLGTYVGSTNAINALRFTWSAGGNFDAGTYALYGVS